MLTVMGCCGHTRFVRRSPEREKRKTEGLTSKEGTPLSMTCTAPMVDQKKKGLNSAPHPELKSKGLEQEDWITVSIIIQVEDSSDYG